MRILKFLFGAAAFAAILWAAVPLLRAENADTLDADTNYEMIHPKRMDRVREQLGVANADEWKIIEQRVGKVLEAQHELGSKAPTKKRLSRKEIASASAKGKGKSQNTVADADALQSSLDSNASPSDMKSLLEKYHAARREKLARLETARDQLRKVLTVRQEVQATLMGLLD
jgi:hypothetical protein